MTERQRIKRWIHFEETDLIPWQINCTTSLADRLLRGLDLGVKRRDTGTRHILKYSRLDDFFGNHIVYARNRGLNSMRESGPGIWRDEWGVLWDRRIDRDIGVPINCLLESGSLSEFSVPDPDDPDRYRHVQPIIDNNQDRYVLAKFSYSLFERAWSLRGMENLFIDFTENTPFVHDLLRSICDFNIKIMRNLASFRIDGIYFGDDWGSQKAMLMSPEMWRQFIKPYLKEMYSQAHNQGYDVFIHSCGHITPILDDLIEIGLNVFNPFQPEVMDLHSLMKRYSRRLAFYGSLSIQKTLPFGTAEEVQVEVQDRISLARAYGGLIISPSHDMPPDVPVENIIALISAIKNQ